MKKTRYHFPAAKKTMIRFVAFVAASIVPTLPLQAQSILPVAGGATAEGRPATAVGIDPSGIATDGSGNVWFVSGDHRIRYVDAATGLISTAAGNGRDGLSGDGGPATQAALKSPGNIARDASGNLFIADTFNGRIRRVDGVTGIITTVAGRSGSWGWAGDGGPATEALLNKPVGIAVDVSGHLFIGERIDPRVRRVDLESGIITTLAGNGSGEFGGDGGPATLAFFGDARSLAVDGARGFLYIADSPNNRIRRVDLAAGTISTIAGNGNEGFGGDDGPAVEASLDNPFGIGLDDMGNLYIADRNNIVVRRVDYVTGVITTVAGSGDWGFAGDGGPATEARFKGPENIAPGVGGELYIADELDNRIRYVDAAGVIRTIAGNGRRMFTGDGGPATQSSFSSPGMVSVDDEGNLFVADGENRRVRRIDASSGIITTVAGNGDHAQRGDAGDGGPATEASFKWPGAVAVDRAGNVFVGDRWSERVRRVDVSGNITTFAGTGETGRGGDGGPATEATLNGPDGLAVDTEGNIYIADVGNHLVRRVEVATGIITTVAGNGEEGSGGDDGPATIASLSAPEGVAVDSDGNLFIADGGNHRVRRVDATSGYITTVAGTASSGSGGDGGPATAASLISPKTVAVDGNDLYIADTWSHRIRRVDGSTGFITTVAGNRTNDSAGDGGPATEASISISEGIAVDGDGSLYIAENFGNRIRVVHKCVEIVTPELTTPSDGSQGLSRFPSLGWEKVSGAFRYDVYLDDARTPQRLVANDVETTTFAPVNLEPLITYYWKVVAKGDPFCDPYQESESEVRSFTTTSECQAPGL